MNLPRNNLDHLPGDGHARRLRTSALVPLLVGLLPAVFAESVTSELKSLDHTVEIRAKAFTEKAENIACPVSWVPLTYVVEDGAKVEKGQVIATFDETRIRYDLETLERQRDVIDASLAHRLTEIENKELDMKDRLASLQDQLAVLQARLTRLRSLPLADEVRIAAGRYRVATMNAEAETKDLEKAKDRFEREMISRTELDDAASANRRKRELLEFARSELEYAKLPASSASLQQTELETDNVQREIRKLENELAEYKEISGIQKQGAQARRARTVQRIEETREDLQNTSVEAPISGYVSYNRSGTHWDVEIAVGAKMWENFNFLRIPDMSTLAFRGVLREAVRKHFSEGDPVSIRLQGRASVPISGRVDSISTLSHDLAEKEEGSWGSIDREFGVKVFDLVIKPEGPLDWVRPGMVGSASITAREKVSGPAVPVRFVKLRDDATFLAIDGVFRDVKGTMTQGYFVMDDDALLAQTITMRGEFPGATDADDMQASEELLSVTGELLPVTSLDVIVRDIGRWPWPKVTWLIDEETQVKQGDMVAKLDPKETDRRVQEEENQLSEAESRRDELKKQLELTKREGEFKLRTEQNLLQIQKLKMETTLNGTDSPAIFSATLTYEQARIGYDDVSRKLAREQGKKLASLSRAEMERLERDERRKELKLEQGRIRLALLEAGATEVERSEAKLDYLKQQVKVRNMQKEIEFEEFRKEREYQQAVLRYNDRAKRLEKLKQQRENHSIKSPAEGMICYNKIWNSGTISKVSIGSMVGPRFNILSLPDLSSMYVSVEVPEKYFSQVEIGMPVDVRIPSLTKRTLKGELASIDFLFENREKKDSQVGLYSSHEPLGEVVFKARINVKSDGLQLKPGAVAEVYFPFPKA